MKNNSLTYVDWVINCFQVWNQDPKLASEAQNQSKKGEILKYKDSITGKGKVQQQMKSWVFINPLKIWWSEGEFHSTQILELVLENHNSNFSIK